MDRERVKELLPVLEAFAEGRAIQGQLHHNEPLSWEDIDDIDVADYWDFRVKPEARVIFLYDCGGDPTDVYLGEWPTRNTIKDEKLVKFREVLDE